MEDTSWKRDWGVCLSERSERHQRIAGGCVPMNTSPKAGVHSLLPPDPHYGSGPLRLVHPFRRAKSEWMLLLLPAHRGLLPSRFAGGCILTYPAWCLLTCLVRLGSGGSLPSYPGSARVGGVHTAQRPTNFRPERAQWPGGKKEMVDHILPAGRDCPSPRKASPVNGVRGKPPVSTRCAKVLTEGGPGDLWFFPSLERTISASPPRRAEFSKNEKVGAT